MKNCLRITSVFAIGAALSTGAFSATLTSDNLDHTGTPVPYRVNPVTSSAINFPALTLTGGTTGVGNLLYYFGNSGTATTGVTSNQGTVVFTAGSITGATAATPGTFTYIPAAEFYGADTFTYYIHDSSDSVDTVAYTVTLLVGDPLNVETESQDVLFTLTPAARTLSNFTAAGGVSTYAYAVTVNPVHGTLSATNAATPTYTPNDMYYGADHFYYTITDSATPPAIISGRFDINVQAQGIHTLPEEDLSVTGQITGSKTFVVDGGGTLALENTQPSLQNSFSGNALVKNSVVVLRNAQQLPTANVARLNSGFIGARDKTIIANHIDLR
ncbi:MAG: cadherin-like domain-containing protein [Pseudomonadota bacterium]